MDGFFLVTTPSEGKRFIVNMNLVLEITEDSYATHLRLPNGGTIMVKEKFQLIGGTLEMIA